MKLDKERFDTWLNTDPDRLNGMEEMAEIPYPPRERIKEKRHELEERIDAQPVGDIKFLSRKFWHRVYTVFAVICCVIMTAVLLATVAELPRFGEFRETINELTERYIVSGLKETGAVNIVAGIILDYRAFDTLGESFVLFCALNCVLILLRIDSGEDTHHQELYFNLAHDDILRKSALFSIPIVFVYGIYVLLNGHLSPGGGFSGGAVIGAGIILLSIAYGERASGALISEKVFRTVCFCALAFYCVAKSYSFFTGANHLQSIIKPGTPGAILSGGLILPLNIAVGMVVSCTIYGMYRMFKKGRF